MEVPQGLPRRFAIREHPLYHRVLSIDHRPGQVPLLQKQGFHLPKPGKNGVVVHRERQVTGQKPLCHMTIQALLRNFSHRIR